MDNKPTLYRLDTVDDFNKLYGFETLHPLVTVVDMAHAQRVIGGTATFSYGLYALFLKQTYCGDITYGRQPYDYQEGTVATYAPGQTVTVSHRPDYRPNALGLLFHPDLVRGTELGRDIGQYTFFDYDVREALHLSQAERHIVTDCFDKTATELHHAIDNHSRRLICRNVQLLLDYCMRFYERQFITRHSVNSDVLSRFERLLNEYFGDGQAARKGLPSVRFFAEQCYLSPNYFGDLVKKETGRTPQEMIQHKIIGLAKEQLAASDKSVSEVAWQLGFQYAQHFNRFFKRNTGMTPSEYRRSN